MFTDRFPSHGEHFGAEAVHLADVDDGVQDVHVHGAGLAGRVAQVEKISIFWKFGVSASVPHACGMYVRIQKYSWMMVFRCSVCCVTSLELNVSVLAPVMKLDASVS